MADKYPIAIEEYTLKIDNVHDVMAKDVNDLQDALTAIMTELGTLPKGAYDNVRKRLEGMQDSIDNLNTYAELTTNKGMAGGYPSLDETGKIPSEQLPDIQGMETHDNTWHSVAYTSTHTHVQITPNITWAIEHPLNRKPGVTIVRSDGKVVLGTIDYIDNSNLTVSFANEFSGKAILT